MTSHRTIESDVGPFLINTKLLDHAKAAARNEALDAGADRLTTLAAAASEVERYCSRLFWRAAGARRSEAIVDVTDHSQPVSICPDYPDLRGVSSGAVAVDVWQSGAWVNVAHELRPAGRFMVPAAGEYRIVVDLTPADPAPVEAIEGTARLYALRTTLRPGDKGIDEAALSLGAAMSKSGAFEVLRFVRKITM